MGENAEKVNTSIKLDKGHFFRYNVYISLNKKYARRRNSFPRARSIGSGARN